MFDCWKDSQDSKGLYSHNSFITGKKYRSATAREEYTLRGAAGLRHRLLCSPLFGLAHIEPTYLQVPHHHRCACKHLSTKKPKVNSWMRTLRMSYLTSLNHWSAPTQIINPIIITRNADRLAHPSYRSMITEHHIFLVKIFYSVGQGSVALEISIWSIRLAEINPCYA